MSLDISYNGEPLTDLVAALLHEALLQGKLWRESGLQLTWAGNAKTSPEKTKSVLNCKKEKGELQSAVFMLLLTWRR